MHATPFVPHAPSTVHVRKTLPNNNRYVWYVHGSVQPFPPDDHDLSVFTRSLSERVRTVQLLLFIDALSKIIWTLNEMMFCEAR